MPTHMILEVLSKADDYGRIFFQADGAGAISHTRTCLFVKPRKHEPPVSYTHLTLPTSDLV